MTHPALSAPQIHFLALHVNHAVTAWRWHWFETMLRASAGKRTATLGREDVEELVRAGLMEWGMGCAWVRATAAGAQAVALAREARKEAV